MNLHGWKKISVLKMEFLFNEQIECRISKSNQNETENIEGRNVERKKKKSLIRLGVGTNALCIKFPKAPSLGQGKVEPKDIEDT